MILLYSSSIVTLEENGHKGQYWKLKKATSMRGGFHVQKRILTDKGYSRD